MAQNAHIRSINMGDSNTDCNNIIGSYNTIYNSDQDAQIMRWLSPLEPSTRYQGLRTHRFEGVGNWLLDTKEWREWRSCEDGDDNAVLFCSGNPGVGKTYLSSLVIDILCDQAKKEDIAVAALYYDFLAQQEQTVTNVMGSILKQLVGRGIPKYIRETFQEEKGEIGGGGLRHADLMGMLKIAIASLRKVFICIDALDECLPECLPELLNSLRDIVQESPTTRIFLTGRPHARDDIQRYFTKVAVIPISTNRDDVRNYLEMRLDRDVDPEAMNDKLRADIERIILKKISDVFLLVSLNVDAILGEVTIRRRKKRLGEVERGNGLGDAYAATLKRLKAQDRNKSILGLNVLMWVLCSQRPLRAEELCHALGVEMGSEDLDPENVTALRRLLASCLSLVTVEASSSTVRLVHFTLQEYLSNDLTLFHNPHSTIAEVCLTYLNFRCVRDLSPALYPPPSTMPLLEYASYYWGEHARRGMTETVKLLALRLLDRFDEHISAQLLLLHYNQTRSSGPYFDSARGPTGFTGLHGVVFLGIAEIVATVLKMKKWDINAADCMGCTALAWAVRGGQEEIIKLLLEQRDIDPNTADTQDGRMVVEEPEANLISSEEIGKRLKDMIMKERRGLQKMYGGTEAELDQSLDAPIKRGEEMAKKLITEMGCDRMVAKELTVLTLYDVAILIDDSDSMVSEENGKRKKTMIQFIDHITEICLMANKSGILAIRFMNSARGKENWTGQLREYLDRHSYGGVARIGTELKEKILDKFAIGNPNQSRPLLVLIVTDGVVEGERKGHLRKVIRDCVNEREGAGKGFDAVSFQFSLIGNDLGAAQLLTDLDYDLEIGEYIDVLPIEFDLERQLEDKWFVLPKILLGAILPEWDEQDYYNYPEERDLLADKKDTWDADSGSDWEY